MLQNSLDTKIPSKYFLLIAIFSVINIFLIIFSLFSYTAPFSSDSESYVETAKFLKGLINNFQHPYFRMLKPVMPFLIAIGSNYFDYGPTLILINAIFYFLIGFIIFKIIKLLFSSNFQALIGSLLFLSAYPILEYGLTYMTDTVGWFFAALSVYLTLLFLKKPSNKWVILNGLVCLVGFLTKEYIVLGILFFFICLFFVFGDDFKQKLKYFSLFCLIFLPPFFAWHTFVYLKFHFSYYNWFALGRSDEFKRDVIKVTIKSLAGTFLLGWVFVLAGILKIKNISSEIRKILLALVLPSFTFLFWIGASSRLFYIIAVLLSIIASFGFVTLIESGRSKKIAATALLGLVFAGNYFWLIFDDRLRQILNAFLNIRY